MRISCFRVFFVFVFEVTLCLLGWNWIESLLLLYCLFRIYKSCLDYLIGTFVFVCTPKILMYLPYGVLGLHVVCFSSSFILFHHWFSLECWNRRICGLEGKQFRRVYFFHLVYCSFAYLTYILNCREIVSCK